MMIQSDKCSAIAQPSAERPEEGEPMGILSEKLSTLQTRAEINSLGCSVARLKTQLDAEDQQAFTSALNSKASTRSIHQTLRAAGHIIDRNLLSLHRKGHCACTKENTHE
jgi:hypothetical protein